jgi:hypothetical protein
LVLMDVNGRAHGAHHLVQGASLILKLVLDPLLMGSVMGRDRLLDLLAGRRDIEDLRELLIGA